MPCLGGSPTILVFFKHQKETNSTIIIKSLHTFYTALKEFFRYVLRFINSFTLGLMGTYDQNAFTLTQWF